MTIALNFVNFDFDKAKTYVLNVLSGIVIWFAAGGMGALPFWGVATALYDESLLPSWIEPQDLLLTGIFLCSCFITVLTGIVFSICRCWKVLQSFWQMRRCT